MEIISEYRDIRNRQELSGEDHEFMLQEQFSRVKQACEKLATRYSGKNLKAEEHFALCKQLSDFQEGFQNEAEMTTKHSTPFSTRRWTGSTL